MGLEPETARSMSQCLLGLPVEMAEMYSLMEFYVIKNKLHICSYFGIEKFTVAKYEECCCSALHGLHSIYSVSKYVCFEYEQAYTECRKFIAFAFAAIFDVPYFSGYKTEFFSFQNTPKDLDPSCKMDLDLWDCLRRVKLVLSQNFIGLIKLFEVILEGQKPCLIAG